MAVIDVGKIRLGEGGNTILKWNFQTVLSEFILIRIDGVSGPCEDGHQVSGYAKGGGEFREQLNKRLHFAKDCVLLKYQNTPSRTGSRHSQETVRVKVKLSN